jgi:hypothetical protein
MKPCSSFVVVAIWLSVFALHVRPVASIYQSCLVDLDCNFDNNTTVDVAIEFTICDPEAQVCVTLNDLRDIDCPCSNGEDCQSGRCEGLFGATCQAKLEDGQGCNEESDCVSGDCNFRFICFSRTEEPTSAPIAQLGTPSSTTDATNDNDDATNGNDDDESNAGFIAGVIIGAITVVVFILLCCTKTNSVCNGDGYKGCKELGECCQTTLCCCLFVCE